MKINGRKLQLDGFALYNDTQLIKIEGADSSKKYKVLFNGEIYDTSIVDNSILFFIPEVKDINIISLNVYDGTNYLYSTNSLELILYVKNIVNVQETKTDEKVLEQLDILEKKIAKDKYIFENINEWKEDLEGKISNQIKQIEDKFNNQLNYIDETKERLKFNSRVKL